MVSSLPKQSIRGLDASHFAIFDQTDLVCSIFNDTPTQLRSKGLSMRQTYGVEHGLPVFADAMRGRLTFPRSWVSGNYTDFAEWREQARDFVHERLLAPPPTAPFDADMIGEEDRGSYVARRVVFNLTGDSRVLAYLCIPKAALEPGAKTRAALLLHDHGARFDIGKEKVIRPFDESDERIASSAQWVNECYGGRHIGDELAARGWITFATDMFFWSDRGVPRDDPKPYPHMNPIGCNLFFLGSSLAGLIAHEDLRALDFLASQPNVDPSRIAAVGLSVGAFRTWQISALDDRVAAGCAICWMTGVRHQMRPGVNLASGTSFTMIHPGLHNGLDFPDVASIACPKPMLFYNGLRDGLFSLESVEYAYDRMRRVWEPQGVGDRLETRLWDVPHEFNAEMQDAAFEWLDGVVSPE